MLFAAAGGCCTGGGFGVRPGKTLPGPLGGVDLGRLGVAAAGLLCTGCCGLAMGAGSTGLGGTDFRGSATFSGVLNDPLGRVDLGRLGVAAGGLLCTVVPALLHTCGPIGGVDLGRLGVAVAGLLCTVASELLHTAASGRKQPSCRLPSYKVVGKLSRLCGSGSALAIVVVRGVGDTSGAVLLRSWLLFAGLGNSSRGMKAVGSCASWLHCEASSSQVLASCSKDEPGTSMPLDMQNASTT